MKIKTALLALAMFAVATIAHADEQIPKYWLKVGAIFAGTKESLKQARNFFYVEEDKEAYATLIMQGMYQSGPVVSLPLKTPKRIFLVDVKLGLLSSYITFHFKGDPDIYWVALEDVVNN
jgi:hypothetical protein